MLRGGDDGTDDGTRAWLAGLADGVGAAGAVIALLSVDGRAVEPRWWWGYPEELVDSWRQVPVEFHSPLTEAVRTRRVVSVSSRRELARRYPQMVQGPLRGDPVLAAVPLRGRSGAPLGVLGLSFRSAGPLRLLAETLPDVADRLTRRLLAPDALIAAMPTPEPPSAADAPEAPQASETPETPEARPPRPGSQEALHELTERLLAAVSPEDVLDLVTAHAEPVVGAHMVNLSLLEAAGRSLRLVRSRNTPLAVEQEFDTYPVDAPLPSREALRTGQPVLLGSLAERDARYPALASVVVEQQAFAVLHIPGTRGALGVLGVGWPDRQSFSADQVRVLTTLAHLCGATLERAQQYAEQQQARQAAERATRQLHELQLLTQALAKATDAASVGEVIVQAAATLGADAAVMAAVDEQGQTFTVLAATGLPPERVARWMTFSADGSALARDLIRTRQPELITSFADRDARFPDLTDSGISQQAWASLPLLVGARMVGLACFGWTQPRDFTEPEITHLTAVGTHFAIALDRARLVSTSQATAEILQRALLPQVPEMPGWDVATVYTPAVEGTHVGGDWYDAFPLPGGKIGLALGDVAGKGIRAAAVMGAARNVLRALAQKGAPPALVLTELDRFLTRYKPDELLTCCYAVLDPKTDRLTYSSAGHPPVLVVTAHDSRWLDAVTDAPVGAPSPCPRTESSVDLRQIGDDVVVLLYSDGLVERRRDALTAGLDALAAAATALVARPRLQPALDALVRSLQHPDATGDDLAVLAIRRTPGVAQP